MNPTTAKKPTGLPEIVTQEQWQKSLDAVTAKEKEATRASDALAAERRRLPMARVEKTYEFTSVDGNCTLLDLFAGRPQLIVYHFMLAPGVNGWPTAGCPGCSLFVDQIGHLAHLNARDVSLTLVSRGPLANLLEYRKRMGWTIPWVSSEGSDFNVDFGVTTEQGETHGLSVLVRDGDAIYRTYFTTDRGCESLGTLWSLLDVTPFGRQETWEDTPPGRPQSAPYVWWHRHDEYPAQSGGE